jgi:hypothetical protein
MLQLAPDAKVEREAETRDADEIYCAACGHVITNTKWKTARGNDHGDGVDGGHEHVFFNPAGVVFRVICFAEAPGVGGHGTPSDEFTWFKGYRWQVAHCLGCNEHLGWRFGNAGDVFFGLIKPKLTMQKKNA